MSSRLTEVNSLLPVTLINYLSANPPTKLRPVEEVFKATVLFLDISGFVDLSSRLAEKGAIGAEELSTVLNSFFGHVIDTVYSFGGDVVKLAGDGMIAIWNNDDPTSRSPALSAAWCAFRIQDQCAGLSFPDGEKLFVKIGLSQGEIRILYVGGVQDRWEILPSGRPLVEVGEAERLAGPGEIVASPDYWEEFETSVVGTKLPNKYYRMTRSRGSDTDVKSISEELSPTVADHLKSFLPRSVRSRLDRGILNWIGELRRVTVLFAFPGERFNPQHLALAEIQDLTLNLQEIVYYLGGNVNKWTVDEKGVGLIVGFGLPPKAHEDDPVRAIKAALKIERVLKEAGGRGGIGLATGTVYCGLVGGDRRREYTVLGSAVNRAARLAFAAGDKILCDSATRYACQEHYQFQASDVESMKGLRQDIKVFTPLEGDVKDTSSTEVIGHAHAMEAMELGVRRLLSGESAAILLEGEAGIGKSTLVRHWRNQAQSHGIRVVSGAGKSLRKTTPYYAWRNILNALMGLDQHPDLAAAGSSIEKMLSSNSRLKLFVPLLNDIVPLGLSDNFMTEQMAGKIRADNTRSVVAALIAQWAAKERLALVLEDLHWCDSQSIALAEAVAREVHPAMLVLSTRPVPPGEGERLPFAETQQPLQRISLKNLDRTESRDLVGRKLGVADVAPEVIDFIYRKTLGNPLFVEEMAYALVESGLVAMADGRCEQLPGASMENVEMPGHLQGVVTQRIDRLAQSTQIAVKVASVIGERFPTDLLREIYPLEDERTRLETHLARLEHCNILLHITGPEFPSYCFSHALIHETIYGLILFKHREALHETIARKLEDSESQDPRMSAAVLGHHWEKAGNMAKATYYLSLAGELAIQDGGYREGLELINRTIDAHRKLEPKPGSLRDDFDFGRWYCLKAEAQLGLGRLMESAQSFLKAAELLGDPFPETVDMAAIVQANLNRIRDAGLEIVPARLTEAERKRCRELVRCFEVLSLLNLFSNNLPACLAAAHKALIAADRLGNSPERARALAMLALALSLVPERAAAEAYLRQALRVTGELQQEFTRARVCEFVGMYYMANGRWLEAEDAFRTAIEGFRNMGDLRRQIECTCLLSTYHHYRGVFGKRVVMGMEVSDLGHTSGDLQAKAWGQLDQIESLICLGEFETSQLLARELIQSIGRHIIGADIIMAYGLVARLYLRLGELGEASRFAQQCLEHMRQGSPTIVYNLEAYAGAAETLLAIWKQAIRSRDGVRLDQARSSARDACDQFRRYAKVFPIAIPRYLLLFARKRHLSGDIAGALRCTRWSLRVAVRLAMPYEEALAKWQLSQWLDPYDPSRRILLEEANSLFAELNASYELKQTQAALEPSV